VKKSGTEYLLKLGRDKTTVKIQVFSLIKTFFHYNIKRKKSFLIYYSLYLNYLIKIRKLKLANKLLLYV